MTSYSHETDKALAQQTNIIYGLVLVIAALIGVIIWGWFVYVETRHQRELSEGDAIDAQSRISELEAKLAE